MLHHSDNAEMMESILERSTLPVGIIDNVVDNLSNSMRQSLEEKYGDLAEFKTVKKALDKSLEMTRLTMMGFTSNDKELMRLIQQLEKSQKLSPFSALSMGNVQLFEVCISRILRVPLSNVRILLGDDAGFRLAYDRAQLPPPLLEATKLAVKALREAEAEGRDGSDMEHLERIINRMRELAPESDMRGVEQLAALLQHRLR